MLNKFDVHKSIPYSLKYSSSHPVVLGLCDSLWEDIRIDKTKKVHLKKECLINTVVNLKVSWITSKYIRYSRRKNNYSELPLRYKPEYYTYNIMTPVMDGIESLGLTKTLLGFINLNDDSKLQTAVCLKDDFKDIKNNMIEDIKPTETVVLKDRASKIKINYKDDALTRGMRSDLAFYSDLRQSTNFSLKYLTNDIIIKNSDYLAMYSLNDLSGETKEIDLRNPYVYRVFNGKFDMGGRYYNGLESNASKVIRGLIHINGNPTVEKDYSCLHIKMLYNTKGLDLKTDAYDQVSKGDPDLRRLYKLIGLVSINSENITTCFSALRDEIRKSDLKKYFDKITDENIMKYYEQWTKAHPKISGYMNSDIGITLQNSDSKIAADIIKYFTDKAIPVLVVHDSFIIEQKYEYELVDVMKSVYKKMFKFEPVVN